MYIMAFDVSKGKSYIVLYKNQDLIYEGELPHNPTAFNELLPFLKRNKVELVFEATGVYSKPLEHLFETNGFDYYCLNPLEASFQTATLRQMKTDQADAHRLALSHLKFNRQITIPASLRYRELKAMSFSYHQVHDELLVNRNYLHSELQYTFPGIEEIYKDNLSQYVLKILEKYPHPDYVTVHSRTKIKNFIKKQTKKRMSEQQAVDKAEWIQNCAKNSYSIVNKDSFRVKQVRKRIQKIDRLLTEKKAIRQDLISGATVLSDFSILESIPGIGELTSALLLAELGDIQRFKTNMDSKFSTAVYFLCALLMLVPFQSVMIPLVSLFGRVGMLNRTGLIFMNIGFGSSMSVFLYYGALRSIPVSLDEAAYIDGANFFQIYWRVIFPILKPTTVTVIILNAIRLWNDYLLPSLVINQKGMYTIHLQMYYFFGEYTIQWELALAGLMLAIIPIILPYIFLQKHIVEGVTEGATK